MPDEENKLAIKKPGFRVGSQLTGIEARRLKAEADKKAELIAKGLEPEINPAEMEHRIGIVFDDSGSMSSDNKIEDAYAGIEEFLRSCERNKTAITIYPMCSKELKLSTNLPALAILVKSIKAEGSSTPLRSTLEKMRNENRLTRMIVFSDGIPDSEDLEGIGAEFGCVDTVLIESTSAYGAARASTYMQELAERTGGYFLKFKSGSSNFRTAFKYLSPGLRYMLADRSFVDKLEGKVKQ